MIYFIINTFQYKFSDNIIQLNADNFENRTAYIILYISEQNCPSCVNVIKEYERVAMEVPKQVSVVDCDKNRPLCNIQHVTQYPTIKCQIRQYSFHYGEPTFQAERIAAFIQVTLGPIMIQFESRNEFHKIMEQHQFTRYFTYQGNNSADAEELFFVHKGKMRVGYFVHLSINKLKAYRDGNEITFKGPWEQNASDKFIKQQLLPIFPKLSLELIQQMTETNLLNFYVIYDQEQKSQKETLKWMKKFAEYHQIQQTLIGQNFAFAYFNAQDAQLRQLLIATKIKINENPFILIADNTKNQFIKYELTSFDTFEDFLKKVINGQVPFESLNKYK